MLVLGHQLAPHILPGPLRWLKATRRCLTRRPVRASEWWHVAGRSPVASLLPRHSFMTVSVFVGDIKQVNTAPGPVN